MDRNYEELPTIAPQIVHDPAPAFDSISDQIRLVGIMKSDTEPLVNSY